MLFRTRDQSSAAARRYGGEPSKFLRLPDGSIAHYRDHLPDNRSPSATLVLLHGGSLSLFWWEPLVERLRASMRVITVDFPGHGLTEAVERNQHPAAFTTFVDLFTRTLGLDERFALIGHSMGGHVAWRFALDYPERLTGLVLIAPGGVCDLGGLQKRVAALVRRRSGALLFKARFSRSRMASAMKACLFDASLITSEMVDRDWALSRRRGALDATIARFRSAAFDPAMVARLSEIRLPTLLIWGQNDVVFPPDQATRFTQTIPTIKSVVYDRCGHWPMIEHAARAAEDIKAFVAEFQGQQEQQL
jgi:pimeloyl-ACP methyl ester carboxylesterase